MYNLNQTINVFSQSTNQLDAFLGGMVYQIFLATTGLRSRARRAPLKCT